MRGMVKEGERVEICIEDEKKERKKREWDKGKRDVM